MAVQLISFDKNRNLQYAGFCKIKIVELSLILLIEPKNEEFKLISAIFKWDFIRVKNIIYVFAEHDFMDFALVFKNEDYSQKVFSYIPTKKQDSPQQQENSIRSSFLLPIFEKINQNPTLNSIFVEIIAFWMTHFDDDLKQVIIKFMKDHDVFDFIMPVFNLLQNNRPTIKSEHSINLELQHPRIISQSMFGFARDKKGKKNKKLIVFASKKKDLVYFFRWNRPNSYMCCSCEVKKTFIFAKTLLNKYGVKYLKFDPNRQHVCKPKKFHPEMLNPIIIPESLFFFTANKNGDKNKKLVAFSSEKKDHVYHFRPHSKTLYTCNTCEKMKKYVPAKIYKDENGKKRLEVNASHVCESFKYEKEKYNATYEIPQSLFQLCPNLKGEKNKRLIIFTSEKKELFYNFCRTRQCFSCVGCMYAKKRVYAKVREGENGEKYVEMNSTQKHICKPKNYKLEKLKDEKRMAPKVTVPESMFKLCKNDKGEKDKKLIMFTSEKKDYCYSYYKKDNRFVCALCNNRKKSVFAKLLQNEDGENYLELSGTHVCPKKAFK